MALSSTSRRLHSISLAATVLLSSTACASVDARDASGDGPVASSAGGAGSPRGTILPSDAGRDATTSPATADAADTARVDDAGDARAPAPPVPFAEWRHREPIYELYVRHFSPEGDFRGVEDRLPELAALGVGILWLLPVHEIGSLTPVNGGEGIDFPHGNPYAVRDYEHPNPEYGRERTRASAERDLESLVRSAHDLGMHVILDWVPNHTAWDNRLVTEHPEWYVHEGGRIQPVGDAFPWIAQLDWSNEDLRAWMTDEMARWVRRYDLDGFRVDFAHAMPLEPFDSLRAKVGPGKSLFLLAEAGDRRFHPTFDMTYDWTVYPVFGDVASGRSPTTRIDDALLHGQLVPFASEPEAIVMRMTYNHDDNGTFTLQDRYRGGQKAFAVVASLLPGKPLLFDGQEVGMNVFDGTTVRPSAPLGHDPAVKIDWNDPDGCRPFYTKLLRLFRANRALHQPGMADFRKLDTVPASPVYAFVRRAADEVVVVVANLSDRDLGAVVLAPAPNVGSLAGDFVELFDGTAHTLAAGTSVRLPPWGYRVFVRGPRA